MKKKAENSNTIRVCPLEESIQNLFAICYSIFQYVHIYYCIAKIDSHTTWTYLNLQLINQ